MCFLFEAQLQKKKKKRKRRKIICSTAGSTATTRTTHTQFAASPINKRPTWRRRRRRRRRWWWWHGWRAWPRPWSSACTSTPSRARASLRTCPTAPRWTWSIRLGLRAWAQRCSAKPNHGQSAHSPCLAVPLDCALDLFFLLLFLFLWHCLHEAPVNGRKASPAHVCFG